MCHRVRFEDQERDHPQARLEEGIPIVILDRFLKADYLLPLLIDNEQGVKEAFDHLYGQGARQIFYISGATGFL